MSVTYDGQHIPGSPFSCYVYDPDAVKISGVNHGSLGQDMSFNVDTSRAGRGDVTCEIFYKQRSIDARIEALGNNLYKVTFTPVGPGTYTVHVFFNGIEVRGSPFTIEIYDDTKVSVGGEGLKLVPVGKPAHFAIRMKGASAQDLQVRVTGPNRQELPVRVLPASDSGFGGSTDGEVGGDSYKAQYTPLVVGEHDIDIQFFDKSIRGSPFKCYAYDAGAIKVGNIPDGFVGKPVEFESKFLFWTF